MMRTLTTILCILFTTTCEVGASSMGAKQHRQRAAHAARERERYRSDATADERAIWDRKGIPACWNEALYVETERELCQKDFKYFYDSIFSRPIRDRKTKTVSMQRLGNFHLLLIDFLHLDLQDCATYTTLNSLMPERDANGDYLERWLYFKTLTTSPEIQDGSVGPISRMFYESFWQGVVIRICGDGFTKCALAPRGHLKSSVGGMAETAWRHARNPEDRHVIRSVTSDRAVTFLDGIKSLYDTNEKFQRLYGWNKPLKREGVWNTDKIQIKCANRRGVDPTVHAMGMETDAVGSHADNYLNDDVIGESNTLTPALRKKGRQTIQKQQAQREPDSNMTLLGTRYEEDDCYSLIVGRQGDNNYSGSMAQDSCFFVATVLDGDESVSVSTNITPLGYGKPIWPEQWGMQTVRKKRAGMQEDDRVWFCQYFNQTIGTSNRVFSPAHIAYLPEDTDLEKFAKQNRLNIYIGMDTGSGKPIEGKRDDTAAFCLGQTQDRRKNYLLDGLREKLVVDDIARGLCDLGEKWYEIAKSYNGEFRIGFEKTKWEKALGPVLRDEQRARGIESLFSIELLSHESVPKIERIKVLRMPYRHGRIVWPTQLWVKSLRTGENYDLVELLKREYTNYNPHATEDNLLDAHAYAYKIAPETEWKEEPEKEVLIRQIGQDMRFQHDEVLLDMGEAVML